MCRKKLFLAAFVCTLFFVACSDDSTDTETTVSYPVEISMSFPEKALEFQYSGWDEDKEVAALRLDTRYADKLILSHTGSQIYGTESEKEISESTEFAFLYPASASTVATSDTTTQKLYINNQDGTLDGLAMHDYTWGTYIYDMDDVDYSPISGLVSLMSFRKFQFTENGQPLERISQVIITSPTDSIVAVGSLNLYTGSITSLYTGSIVIRNEQGLSGEVYAAFFPMKSALHFVVSTLDGKSYEASLPEEMEFNAGTSAIHTSIVCTALEPARMGDYYYNDGTWSTQFDESKKCVGIVYALGDADGNINKNLSESAHGRVVALKDAAKQVSWGSTSLDVEGIENQTVLQDTMYVGSLPYLDGTPDSFFSDNSLELLNGIRIDVSTGQINGWYSAGALSDFDGQENTREILWASDTHEAVTYIQSYGKGLYDWALPSAGDLALLWALHRTGILCNEAYPEFEDFHEWGYWTSTEYDEGNAWYINFFSGMVTKNSKNSLYDVRPVIRF